jgi:hypothetical protein
MEQTSTGKGSAGVGSGDVAHNGQPGRPLGDRHRAGRWRSPDEACSNCGDPTHGRFCHACGQRKTVVQVSVGAIVGEVLKDELALNSALPRTLVGILLRPGYLTNEYIRGRIVRYIPPLRLYLITSILFFLVLSLVSLRALDRTNVSMLGEAAVAVHADRDSAIAELRSRRQQLLSDTGDALTRPVLRQALARTEASLWSLGDTVTSSRAADADSRAGLPRPVTTMQPWAEDVRQTVQTHFLQRPVERKLAQLGHLPPREAIRAFLQNMLEYAPHMMFVLLPVFALILKLLYVRRARFYAEHFVFALHVHAFFFLMFFIVLILPGDTFTPYLMIWMMIYVWLAMKRVYRQGWFRTTVKWWVLGWSYSLLLTLGLLGLALSTIVIG